MFHRFVVAAPHHARSVHFVSNQVAPGFEIRGVQLDRNLEFPMRFPRPGHCAQEHTLFGPAAVGLGEPVAIHGIPGSQLHGALEARRCPRKFPQLVITLAEKKMQ